VEFTDAEYAAHLSQTTDTNNGSDHSTYPPWTREETEHLLKLAHRYDLRWPVIHDRWEDDDADVEDGGEATSTSTTPTPAPRQRRRQRRPVEQLQHRYLTLTQKLLKERKKR
jgi:DNA methyltransferase 1-associated protein 1